MKGANSKLICFCPFTLDHGLKFNEFLISFIAVYIIYLYPVIIF